LGAREGLVCERGVFLETENKRNFLLKRDNLFNFA
jgi:hypothetical protein